MALFTDGESRYLAIGQNPHQLGVYILDDGNPRPLQMTFPGLSLPPRFPPASLAVVLVAPVTMTADPEHRATAGPPAEPPPQRLFAAPHPSPSGGREQLRLAMAISIPSTDALLYPLRR